jgi:protocatechuate 3,4-dioxygenase beta subunit
VGDLVLAAPRRVEGRVLGADGSPQGRNTVILSGPLTGDEVGSFYGRSVTAATDDLGRFRFAEVEPGDYDVVVRPRGAQEIRKRVRVPGDRDVLDVRIERQVLRQVRIAVTDPDGKPLPGVFVGLTDSDNRSIQERTDAAGVAHVTVPAGRRMTWSVYPPPDSGRTWLQPAWSPLPGDTDDLRLALEEAALVSGRIVDPEGAPVARAWLRLVGADGDERWTEADDEGRFTARVRKESRSLLAFDGAVASDGTRRDSGLEARVPDVAAGSDVTVQCARVALDRKLTVLVVSPSGEAVPKASVGVLGPNGSVLPGVWPQTDDRGRVTIRDLPARELRIHVSLISAEFCEPAAVAVLPDGQELRLVCRPATRTAGAVVDRNGTPLPWGSVRAEREGEAVASGRIDREGRFVLLLPESDTLPIRVVVDRNGDGAPEAALDGVVPGSEGLRLVVER